MLCQKARVSPLKPACPIFGLGGAQGCHEQLPDHHEVTQVQRKPARLRAADLGQRALAWVFDFQRGMPARMAETLRDMTAERQRDNVRVVDVKGSGRDLAVVRTDLVAKWFSDRGIQLSRGRSSGVKHRSAYGAGQWRGRPARLEGNRQGVELAAEAGKRSGWHHVGHR